MRPNRVHFIDSHMAPVDKYRQELDAPVPGGEVMKDAEIIARSIVNATKDGLYYWQERAVRAEAEIESLRVGHEQCERNMDAEITRLRQALEEKDSAP